MAQHSSPNSQPKSPPEQRQYIRLKSIFPVEFAIIHSPQDVLDMHWQQGYTCNVSKGGICLETVLTDEDIVCRLQEGKAYLELRIRIPLGSPSLNARAEATWVQTAGDVPGRYLIGLKFTSISSPDLNRMVRHAQQIKFSSYIAAFASIFLFCILVVSGGYNWRLRLVNEALVNDLVMTQQEEIKMYTAIEENMQEGDVILKQIKQHARDEGKRKKLESTYEELVRRRGRISDHLAVLARKKSGLQETVLEKMHLWLKNHQSPSTGLIASFEGDAGIVKNWAFIYDQALAAHVFLFHGNEKSARQILNFFNTRTKGGFQGFHNGYYYDSGEVSEFTIHSGPNIWVGIAALQYIHETGDKYYLPMVRKITDWLIALQERDPAGGLKGGPDVSWFSTEHNLDAYALFNMMYQTTGEEKYRLARKKILSWLRAYALIPHGKDYKSPPVNRGRGDATIATDTYAWALAAIGPKQLKKMRMDPEAIMEFAEEHCAVETQYERPSGVVLNVKGFDFAKHAHMPRGGMISPEWTSQMIVSFRMLSDYFMEREDFYKAKYYEEKAETYLNELNKLIISSPSAKGQGEGCLPYATLENADTGHGWNTPFGTSTCSIAGTAYMMMAIKQWNPLMLGH